MVYNNVHMAPASLPEKLRAKFGERTAGAIFRANSELNKGNDGEVISFFGRADSEARDRAIPSRRRSSTSAARPSASVKDAPVKHHGSHARVAQAPAKHKEPQRAANPAVRTNAKTAQRPVNPRVQRPAQTREKPMSPDEIKMRTGSFGKAYAAGDRVKVMSRRVRVPGEGRYSDRKVPKKALAGGRRDIAGSRHAVVRSACKENTDKSFFERIGASFADTHRAEHRVKSAPIPVAYTAIIIICAIMAMVLILSYSQVSEREGMIGDLSKRYDQLAADTAKLELLLEERDDIRNIEDVAVGTLGMVSGDVAQTKFVSVSADDRVEILREDTEKDESGFSALLSVVGESLGKFSEYFN